MTQRRGNRRGRGGGNNGGGRGGSSDDMTVDGVGSSLSDGQPHATVEITNWLPNQPGDVAEFLLSRSHVALRDVQPKGSVLVATCRARDAPILRKYNGVKMRGHPLTIFVRDPPSAGAEATINVLAEFLTRRFDQVSQWLNLNDMVGDAFLREHNLAYTTPTAASKMFKALMRVAADRLPHVLTVSLESNNLGDVAPVAELCDTYPRLQNLSLANNNIQRPGQLVKWKQKLPYLRELVLTNNPIADPINDKAVVEMFPRLQIYNGKTVRTEAEISPYKLPFQIKPTFFENENIQQLTNSFLTNFFQLWDTNRDALMQLYDSVSEFSVSLNATAPRRSGNLGTGGGSNLISLSRNLARSNNIQTRQNRLALGPMAVSSMFRRLPRSRHDLSRAENFAIDAWQIQNVRAHGDTGIIMSLHGMYVELPSNVDRSFDRTFIVLPGPNGSMIVASDMLVIRPLSIMPQPDPATNLGAGVTTAVPNANATVGAIGMSGANAGVVGMPPEMGSTYPGVGATTGMVMATDPALVQQQVVQALMAETRLNPHFAELCAKQANYDLRTALELFDQSRGNLPPNAFQ